MGQGTSNDHAVISVTLVWSLQGQAWSFWYQLLC